MTTAIVRAEIERFLQSSAPEVLCISGRWGVGKTYSWQKYLEAAEDTKKVALSRYAYVSLFGLETLDDLRKVIVENTIALGSSSVPDAFSLRDALRVGATYVRKSRPVFEVGAGEFGCIERFGMDFRARD